MTSISFIDSGFSGLASYALLAAKRNSITVYKKNETIGDPARKMQVKSFLFDMGVGNQINLILELYFLFYFAYLSVVEFKNA